MRKPITVIIVIVIAVLLGIFFYLKLHVLDTTNVQVEKKERSSPADLKPEIIAKLKQLVKDGSGGLYHLDLDSIYTQLHDGQFGTGPGRLYYDTSVYERMIANQTLPDDVFNFTFSGISASGIGLQDLIGKDKLSLNVLNFKNPSLEVFHQKRSFNSTERKQMEEKTLYEKIATKYKAIIVNQVIFENGKLVNHNGNSGVTSRINDVDIDLKNILIDSSTQHDRDRFLFAKHANIQARNYHVRMAKNDYDFKIDQIKINGETNNLQADGVTLRPVGGHNALQKRFKEIKVVYDVSIPHLNLQSVEWWSLFNRDIFSSRKTLVNDATVKVYVDKSRPAPKLKKNNFPHQLLMRVPFPVDLDNLEIINSKVIYYEFNPRISQWSEVPINELSGTIENITNISGKIARNAVVKVRSSAKLLGQAPMKINIDLNLADAKSGAFSANVMLGKVTPQLINPITEPLSLFNVKRGVIHKGELKMTGNNSGSAGKMTLYYEDLHITPLKTDSNSDGQLKSKHLASFIANKLLIKNANPLKGDLRQPEYTVARDPYTGFIKLIWITNMTGILKTIGVPLKAVYK